MSSPIPAAPEPFVRLLNDIETAEDPDAPVPEDPALPGRMPDGWEVLTLEEYALTRAVRSAA